MSGFLFRLSFCSGPLLSLLRWTSWPPSSPVPPLLSPLSVDSFSACLPLPVLTLPLRLIPARFASILYFWPSLSLLLSGGPDSSRLVVLLIHSKVGQSLQEDLRQPNFVLKASPVSQDITGDPPSPPPARPSLHFLLLFSPISCKYYKRIFIY